MRMLKIVEILIISASLTLIVFGIYEAIIVRQNTQQILSEHRALLDACKGVK